MALYNNTSPWASTPVTQNYLSILKIRPVSAQSDDAIYTIEPQYTYRPDLLAYDLYGYHQLWWYSYKETWMCCKTLYLILLPEHKFTFHKRQVCLKS
jgi:hypothetical protein